MATIQSQSNFLEWILNHAATIVTIGNCALILLAFAYILRRSGSLLFIRDRIWRVFGGKSEFSNSKFEKMRKDARELEHFRFEFNIPITTLDEAELAEKWVNSQKLSIADVSLAKPHIKWGDFKKITITTKHFRARINAFALSFIIFAFLTTACTSLITIKYWIANLPNGPTFYASTENVVLSISNNKELTPETCKSPEKLKSIIDTTLFPPDQIQFLCTAFDNEKYITRMQKGISEQREVFSLLSLYCLLISIWLVRSAAKLSAAKRLSDQLIKNISDAQNTTGNF